MLAEYPQFVKSLRKDSTKFGAFFLFLVLVFLTGGSSRIDVSSLIVLRPAAVLFCTVAFILCSRGDIGRLGLPFFLLVALAVLIAIQLVPLPPAIWTGLPGRSIFADIASALSIDQTWRPISLVPSKTLNSLFALAVPFAVFLFIAALWESSQAKIAGTVLGIGLVSAIFGLLQILGPAEGALYTYRITNNGEPVGFFANRNHQAVFLATLYPLIAYFILAGEPLLKEKRLRQFLGLTSGLFLLPLVIITGSRTGTALALFGIVAALFLIWNFDMADARNKSAGKLRSDQAKIGIVAVSVAAVAGVIALTFYFSRTAAFDRLFGTDIAEESRYEVLPYLIDLLWYYFPIGSGFGSFEFVYKAIEPINLLKKSYLNQAHNDFLQIGIEGGIAALAIAVIFAVWFLKQLVRVATNIPNSSSGNRNRYILALASIIIMVMLMIAALFDYLLRTPIGSAYLVILCCWIQRCGTTQPE